MDQTTVAIELVTDYHKKSTQWIFHKSRFVQSVGKSIFTGYDKGKFVSYTSEFQKKIQHENDKIAKENLDRETGEVMDKNNGLPDVFKDNVVDINAKKEEKKDE